MIGPGLRFGRYEVGDRIGRGGFGVVHFARDVELGRELAIKFLRPEYQTRPMVVQRFLQEARAAARIGHPGIVTVFECGQITGTGLRADGTAFIAMELLKGENLGDRIENRGRLPAALAISIGRQLAAALASAHEAGIIHRDLKPDNVFLIPDPAVRGGMRVKILDFGVAKLAEPTEADVHTHSQVMLGTPRYMSPEQARSAARVDHRSDIYALGCILYEILCGRPPYSGDAGDLITKHQSAPVPSPRSVVDSTPQRLDRLITAMLAKAPEDRPGTMTDVDRTLGDCEAAAERPSRPPPVEVHDDEPTLAAPLAEPSDVMATGPIEERVEESTLIQAPPVEHTLSEPTVERPPRRRAFGVPLGLALTIAGGLVFGGLATFVVLRALGGEERAPARSADAAVVAQPVPPPEPTPTPATTGVDANANADATDASEPTAAIEPATAGSSDVLPAGPASPASPRSPAINDLEIECLRLQTQEKWSELDACADRLRSINPTLARDLKNRAVQETRSAPRILGVEAALRNKDLRRAKAELDQVWPDATAYQRLKLRYDAAEAAAIADVVARLDRVNSGDCREYTAILAQERAAKPPRVAAEAARRVKCTAVAAAPSAACNPDLLAERGKELYSTGQVIAALAAFEAAIACRPDPALIQRAFLVACTIPDLAKAKPHWKRLSPALRGSVSNACIRNGITEDELNAP